MNLASEQAATLVSAATHLKSSINDLSIFLSAATSALDTVSFTSKNELPTQLSSYAKLFNDPTSTEPGALQLMQGKMTATSQALHTLRDAVQPGPHFDMPELPVFPGSDADTMFLPEGNMWNGYGLREGSADTLKQDDVLYI